MAPQNREWIAKTIAQIRETYDHQIKIFLWTGYIYEDLLVSANCDQNLKYILNSIDVLIDGPFKQELKDITLPLRGSSNQRVIKLNFDKK